MSLVDLERIASRADRALSRLDHAQRAEASRYLTTALDRTLGRTETAYRQALAEVASGGDRVSPAFRLARGRVLADELEGTFRALGTPSPILEGLLARTADARAQGADFVRSTFETFEDAITLSTPVNHRAISGVVRNASTRLSRHAEDLVDRMKTDVVTSLVNGDSWTTLSRQLRADTGLLRSRADTIAITELHSAQADARQEIYSELGVELVIRYVTIDDRTCPYCAGRQGEVTELGKTTEVLHPRCRCLLAAYNPEWTLDGSLPADELEAMRTETLETFRATGGKLKDGPAPFERGGLSRGRPPVVWRPGQDVDVLLPWIGRAFTNLAPALAPTAGAAAAAARPAIAADPLEVSRRLPLEIRRKLEAIEAEAAPLYARVRELDAKRAKLVAARVAARKEATEYAQERLTFANAQLRSADAALAAKRAAVLRANPAIAAETSTAVRDRLLEPFLRAELDAVERAMKLAREADLLGAAASRAGYDVTKAIHEIALEQRTAERDLALFRRSRAHALLRNEATGHRGSPISVNVRVRDADMRTRTATAVAWLEEHTTFGMGSRTVLADLRRTSKKDGRAFYRPWEQTAFLSAYDGVGTYVHELGHAIDDATRSLVARAIAFRESRTVGETAKRLSVLTGNTRYKPHEISKPDAFGLGPYVGKIYGSSSSEILSMGLEAMYNDPTAFARSDPGHFDFILRIMKGLPDP